MINNNFIFFVLIVIQFNTSFGSNNIITYQVEDNKLSLLTSNGFLQPTTMWYSNINATFQIRTEKNPKNTIQYNAGKTSYLNLIEVDQKNYTITLIANPNKNEGLTEQLKMALLGYVNFFSKQKTVTINVESFKEVNKQFISAMQKILTDDSFVRPSQYSISQEFIQELKIEFLIETNNNEEINKKIADLETVYEIFSQKIEKPVITRDDISDGITKLNGYLNTNPTDKSPTIDRYSVLKNAFLVAAYATEAYYAYTGYQKAGSLKNYFAQGIFFKLPQNRFAKGIRVATKGIMSFKFGDILLTIGRWIKNQLFTGKQ